MPGYSVIAANTTKHDSAKPHEVFIDTGRKNNRGVCNWHSVNSASYEVQTCLMLTVLWN